MKEGTADILREGHRQIYKCTITHGWHIRYFIHRKKTKQQEWLTEPQRCTNTHTRRLSRGWQGLTHLQWLPLHSQTENALKNNVRAPFRRNKGTVFVDRSCQSVQPLSWLYHRKRAAPSTIQRAVYSSGYAFLSTNWQRNSHAATLNQTIV